MLRRVVDIQLSHVRVGVQQGTRTPIGRLEVLAMLEYVLGI